MSNQLAVLLDRYEEGGLSIRIQLQDVRYRGEVGPIGDRDPR